MLIEKLPEEILHMVLSHLVDQDWNGNCCCCVVAGRHQLVDLRRVCHTFDDILTEELVDKASWIRLSYDADVYMSLDTIAEFFIAKGRLGRMHRTELVSMAHCTADALYACQRQDEEPRDKKGRLWAGMQLAFRLNGRGFPLPPIEDLGLGSSLSQLSESEKWTKLKSHGGLAVSAFLGDLYLLRGVLSVVDGPEDPQGPCQPHPAYGYPLYAAAACGHTEAVRLLLDAGASPTNSYGALGSPLEVSVRAGFVDVAGLLWTGGEDAQYVLADALSSRQLVMAEWLLEQEGIDVNSYRAGEKPPILLAIELGFRSFLLRLTTKMELNTNFVPALRVMDLPLIMVIYRNWVDVFRALLHHRNTNVNQQGHKRSTPIQIACMLNRGSMVGALVGKEELVINGITHAGLPLLCHAFNHNYMYVAFCLLCHPDLDILHDGCVLFHAARNEFIARALLPHPRMHRLFVKIYHDAIQLGSVHVVNMLLQGNCIDVNESDKDDVHPLTMAAGLKGSEMLSMLLSSPRMVKNNGNSHYRAFYRAIEFDRVNNMRLLLHSCPININATVDSHTALSQAALHGSVAATQLLLSAANVHPSLWYSSPMSIEKADIFLVPGSNEYRLQWDAANDKRLPLCVAAVTGRVEIVRILLSYRQVNINITDSCGHTPLLLAIFLPGQTRTGPKFIKTEHTVATLVYMFLERPDIDVNKADETGMTPLFLAIILGLKSVVALLLEDRRTDIMQFNRSGWTALHLAQRLGNNEIVEQIRKRLAQ